MNRDEVIQTTNETLPGQFSDSETSMERDQNNSMASRNNMSNVYLNPTYGDSGQSTTNKLDRPYSQASLANPQYRLKA